MKTTTLLAIGAGVLGVGTAAVLLTRKEEPKIKPEPPSPTPGIPTIPGFPSVPNVIPLPGSLTSATDGVTINLKQGKSYQGRLFLRDGNLPPFSPKDTPETLAKGISALGFDNVKVYSSVSQLPANFPRQKAMDANANHRWFEGRWTGANVMLPKPFEVEDVWFA